jgi:hypothetical protein
MRANHVTSSPNRRSPNCPKPDRAAIHELGEHCHQQPRPTLGTPTQPILFGGNLVGAYGTRIANEDLPVVLDWVDGLKAAGVQRIEFNP